MIEMGVTTMNRRKAAFIVGLLILLCGTYDLSGNPVNPQQEKSNHEDVEIITSKLPVVSGKEMVRYNAVPFRNEIIYKSSKQFSSMKLELELSKKTTNTSNMNALLMGVRQRRSASLRPSCDTQWFHQFRLDKYPQSLWIAKCVSSGSPCQVGKSVRSCLEVQHQINSYQLIGRTSQGQYAWKQNKETITINCLCKAQ